MTSDGDENQPDVIESHPGRQRVPVRRRRRLGRLLVVTLAVLIVLAGGGMVVVSYYVDSIDEITPDKIPSTQVTTIWAADGRTQLAQLGTENRQVIPMDILPEVVRQALVAGEDKDFFDDAATASALTRYYVRIATQQTAPTNARKARELVLARKLEDKYTKLEILGFFLNIVDFGRGAVGVEKGAQAYFGKSAKDLTVAEAAMLGAILKEPYGKDAGPSAYDPQAHPDTANLRWAYVLDNMVAKGWITAADRAQVRFPAVRDIATVTMTAQWGIKVNPGSPAGTATGNVVNYIFGELAVQGISPQELRTGGYRITTSIDPQAQTLLEKFARPDLPGSAVDGPKGQPGQHLAAAGVVLDHKTGRILAYYGGIDGTGTDFAGVNAGGAHGVFGGHPAGGTMEVYSLAAALDAGASLRSRWKGLPFTSDDGQKVGNNGAHVACGDDCTLEESFTGGYNVPFYWVARQVGPGKVVKTAQSAGVRDMWTTDGREVLASLRGAQDDYDRAPFDRPVGYGQYPVTVLENAAGVATMANGGLYNAPHFVVKVEQLDPATGHAKVIPGKGERLAPAQTIRRQVADDVTYAMRQTAQSLHGAGVPNRPVAIKTGSWAAGDKAAANSDAWTVGFTPQLTVAVWVGDESGAVGVVDRVTGQSIAGTGAPLRIWTGFVSAYSDAKKFEPGTLAAPAHTGRDDFPGANGVSS